MYHTSTFVKRLTSLEDIKVAIPKTTTMHHTFGNVSFDKHLSEALYSRAPNQ